MRSNHTRRGLRAAAAMAGVAMLPLLWAPFASGFAGSPAWGVFGGSGRSPAREPITRGIHARVERRLLWSGACKAGARVEGLQGRRAARVPHATGAVRCALGAGLSVQTGVVGGLRVRAVLGVGPGIGHFAQCERVCVQACACVCAEETLHVRVPCLHPA
jgi:hypothetical protein